ncbi:Endochitinase A1 [Hyphodiscus hymeniophilus]|uniref:chitinase n=1 Tax=Hyphodiscus hymeniophilus TaxID=353542 RepID=A0A9P6SPJ6_9HELO|nr:Endochitinase A1 [Hyphodiscus hymeniophilus]
MAIFSNMINSVVTAFIVLGFAQAFDPSAKNNVAVYWGQRTGSLAKVCANDAVDVVLLSFMNVFPGGQDGSDLPGTNFAGNCNTAPFPGSHLLEPCAPMPEDIQTCQKLGKKVILALGGESGYQLSGAAAGESFADKLWALAGPMSANHGEPRPFGESQVDGFDFDIEIKSPDNQAGYIAMINRLRSHFGNEERQYFITGAPQCVVPDANMGEMMTKAQFDMLLVQFYNTNECSARRFVDEGEGFTYDALVESLEGTPSENAKIYLGLPAATDAAGERYYLHANEVEKLVQAHAGKRNFGGIMLWDAARAEENRQEGKAYHEMMKDILNRIVGGSTESGKADDTKLRPVAQLVRQSTNVASVALSTSTEVKSVDVSTKKSTRTVQTILPSTPIVPTFITTTGTDLSRSSAETASTVSTTPKNPKGANAGAAPTVYLVQSLKPISSKGLAGCDWNASQNTLLPQLDCTSNSNTILSVSQSPTPVSKVAITTSAPVSRIATRTSTTVTEVPSPTTVEQTQVTEEVKEGSAMQNSVTASAIAVGALVLGLSYLV